MATERLAMRRIREILRQKWALRLSHRAVARSLRVGLGTISSVTSRAQATGLDWAQVQTLTDEALEGRLYGRPDVAGQGPRPAPDCPWIHAERRRPGVTLELLHLEYLERHPDGYRYTQFCDLYRHWLARRRLSMRQLHVAGDKCFVDYAGQKPRLIEPTTGEVVEVELFVAVLGASNYTYAEATRTQQVPEWIASHARAFAYFGGVTAAVVCDQLKSGVAVPCRYEPGLQRTYEEFAEHYGTAILPARPASPRDKAKVEAGVLVAERWILARLRNITCFSLSELNEHIAQLLDDLNNRTMRRYKRSRRDLFDELDKPVVVRLPAHRFDPGDWSFATVGPDYHIRVERDGHDYSVPHTNVGDDVEIRVSASAVEVFTPNNGKRIAAHARSFVRGGVTTLPEHMPAHRKHHDETAADLLAWAQQIGACTHALVRTILDERRHPEHGLRTCRGLRTLIKRYTPDRLEAACERALIAGARSYLNVESILRHGLDKQPLQLPVQSGDEPPPLDHENIRGPDYYH